MGSMIRLNVNGAVHEVQCETHESLADVLHDRLHLIGTRVSCEEGECGCCTVLLDGEPATACLIMAAQAEGREPRVVHQSAVIAGWQYIGEMRRTCLGASSTDWRGRNFCGQ